MSILHWILNGECRRSISDSLLSTQKFNESMYQFNRGRTTLGTWLLNTDTYRRQVATWLSLISPPLLSFAPPPFCFYSTLVSILFIFCCIFITMILWYRGDKRDKKILKVIFVNDFSTLNILGYLTSRLKRMQHTPTFYILYRLFNMLCNLIIYFFIFLRIISIKYKGKFVWRSNFKRNWKKYA